MQNKNILKIINNLSPAKRKYEEKKAKKLSYQSFYDYIFDKVEFPETIKVLDQRYPFGTNSISLLEVKEPPQSQINNLLEHYQSGRLSEAEKLALSITLKFPSHQFGWKVLGAVLEQTGRSSEALNANQKAVVLSPKDAQAHSNLGVTLQGMGRLLEAEASNKQAIALKPDFAEAYNNLGITLQELGKLEDAEASYKKAIAIKYDYPEAYNNLSLTLKELGRLKESASFNRKAIELKSDYTEAYNNLGVTLLRLGKLEESEEVLRQAIALKYDFAEAYNNLCNTLKEMGRLDEAELSGKHAIVLKPNYAQAHNNLGVTLHEIGRYDEAEANYRQAIAIKPDYAEAHNNIAITLQSLGRIEEAEASSRQSIVLKPDLAEGHFSLGKALYSLGNKASGLESMEKANQIDPNSKVIKLLLSVMKSGKQHYKSEITSSGKRNISNFNELDSNPLILNRMVETSLVSTLYEMNFKELDKTSNSDARYGSGICSQDFNLFENDRDIIKKISNDLTKIMMEAVQSEIFIADSFFNILKAGGGLTPHKHINSLDKEKEFNLQNQKYSLVYYLSVGDQCCSEPGILKLFDPIENILPCKGMIMIFPANRLHSAVYGGKSDRVMVGANFYSL